MGDMLERQIYSVVGIGTIFKTPITVDAIIRAKSPNDFDQFLYSSDFYVNQTAPQFDEYEDYLKILTTPCEKPLIYWSKQQEKWPSLCRMALDVLSILFISVECERIFSACDYLITARRNHIKEDIIEALTYLRAWLREG